VPDDGIVNALDFSGSQATAGHHLLAEGKAALA
jgi:hypothetical protein